MVRQYKKTNPRFHYGLVTGGVWPKMRVLSNPGQQDNESRDDEFYSYKLAFFFCDGIALYLQNAHVYWTLKVITDDKLIV